jgi:hypothetical protein
MPKFILSIKMLLADISQSINEITPMQKFILSIKIILGKPMHRQEDTIQMDLKETGYENVDPR